jgi:HTH-type transcriptional regulator, sugar sensing transcriptional regulator
MNSELDLTEFGFTPTESLVYEVLVRSGPGTGYAIARAAGLARANAYSALEGLVQKGAARVEEGRPKRYRPEPPSTLIARIVDHQGQALETLSSVLDGISVPTSPTLVELASARGLLQLVSHEIARAETRVRLVAPADAFPILTPALRKAATSGVVVALGAPMPVQLPFAQVRGIASPERWPGEPFLFTVDGRGAALAAREGDQVSGHWGTGPILVAAADLLIDTLLGGDR